MRLHELELDVLGVRVRVVSLLGSALHHFGTRRGSGGVDAGGGVGGRVGARAGCSVVWCGAGAEQQHSSRTGTVRNSDVVACCEVQDAGWMRDARLWCVWFTVEGVRVRVWPCCAVPGLPTSVAVEVGGSLGRWLLWDPNH